MLERAQIVVRSGVDLKTFQEEILPSNEPVVLQGLVNDWPAVLAGKQSSRALGDYLRGFDQGRQLPVLEGPPSIRGRFFYRDDMRGLNFERKPATISATIERLLGYLDDPLAPSLYVESTPTLEYLPAFAPAHPMPLLPPTVLPRIWLGNALTVSAHFDLASNIACVVGGRRRFTLFPPDQIGNLYVGPIEFNVSGLPISMVSLDSPDFARFPKFAEALRHARGAELSAGDAIFVPYGWWHHVQSLTPFNVLVNYWWNEAHQVGSPFDSMLHAVLAVRDLPPAQRAVWRGIFDHYVFSAPEETLKHLPPEQRGLLGPPSPQRANAIRTILGRLFNRPS
jgi:hypothetical protein